MVRRLSMMGIMVCFSQLALTIAPTAEEKELQKKARSHNKDVKDVIADIKHGWSVIEYFHEGVALNKRVETVLTECWQQAYRRDDSSYSIKIIDRDMVTYFEQFLLELQPHISYYEKQRALGKLKNDLFYFNRESQAEFRPTIELAQRMIVKNLKDYIPLKMRQNFENSTERVFKDGMRFLLYVMLKKHNKGFTQEDVKFVNARLEMYLNEAGRNYPYISVGQFESWACSLLQDLLFSECIICMDKKGEQFMSCCKTKSICRGCVKRLQNCPLCRVPIPKK